ncbi:MAG: MarR family transcriptional regulator [Thermomicrobium sp.]|nr:MarR family transcriptional regulator [Thermomicrobium sp.]MDW8058571.1 MarR family transcriptional regulator [Thermomicrobium sp.]
MTERADLIETIIVEMRDVIAYLHRRSPPPLQALDLSMAQLKVLFALACRGPLTVSEVAERLGISPPTASHLIDRVVQLGLVTRREDERDRRRTLVELTARGEELLRQLRQGNEHPWRELLERLSAEDLEALLRGVRALAAAARRPATADRTVGL